jgi:hypothetical protein
LNGVPHKESTKAAEAYIAYCALGSGRSLAKLAKVLGKSEGYATQLERWSAAHNWQERVRKYDQAQLEELERKAAEEASEKRKKREAEIESMNARHAQIGVTQQLKALEQIKHLIDTDEFGAIASVNLLKLATDLERIARGENPNKIELTGKDGGPILPSGAKIAIYLPQKDELSTSSQPSVELSAKDALPIPPSAEE